jgi:hypothetical protein
MRHNVDMRVRGLQWPDAKVASEADTVDGMPDRQIRREQRRQRGARHHMHDMTLAFQLGPQGRTDKTAAAEDGE